MDRTIHVIKMEPSGLASEKEEMDFVHNDKTVKLEPSLNISNQDQKQFASDVTDLEDHKMDYQVTLNSDVDVSDDEEYPSQSMSEMVASDSETEQLVGQELPNPTGINISGVEENRAGMEADSLDNRFIRNPETEQLGNLTPDFGATNVYVPDEVIQSVGVGKKISQVHACGMCSRTFLNAYKLRRHMRTHTGEKPYPCPVCDRKFGRAEHLRRHLATHTAQKPFYCNLCSFSGPSRDRVQRHIKVKHPNTLSAKVMAAAVGPFGLIVMNKHSVGGKQDPISVDGQSSPADKNKDNVSVPSSTVLKIPQAYVKSVQKSKADAIIPKGDESLGPIRGSSASLSSAAFSHSVNFNVSPSGQPLLVLGTPVISPKHLKPGLTTPSDFQKVNLLHVQSSKTSNTVLDKLSPGQAKNLRALCHQVEPDKRIDKLLTNKQRNKDLLALFGLDTVHSFLSQEEVQETLSQVVESTSNMETDLNMNMTGEPGCAMVSQGDFENPQRENLKEAGSEVANSLIARNLMENQLNNDNKRVGWGKDKDQTEGSENKIIVSPPSPAELDLECVNVTPLKSCTDVEQDTDNEKRDEPDLCGGSNERMDEPDLCDGDDEDIENEIYEGESMKCDSNTNNHKQFYLNSSYEDESSNDQQMLPDMAQPMWICDSSPSLLANEQELKAVLSPEPKKGGENVQLDPDSQEKLVSYLTKQWERYSPGDHPKKKNASPPYVCSLCGRVFASHYKLKRHQMVHTGEKPYPCPKCPKRFTRTEHLKRHLEVHDKLEKQKLHHCKECDYTCSCFDDLRSHVVADHADLDYDFTTHQGKNTPKKKKVPTATLR